jgi:hypothetical protein
MCRGLLFYSRYVCQGEPQLSERLDRVLSLPATQVQIQPVLWRRIEIRVVFRDGSRRLPRIRQYDLAVRTVNPSRKV